MVVLGMSVSTLLAPRAARAVHMVGSTQLQQSDVKSLGESSRRVGGKGAE